MPSIGFQTYDEQNEKGKRIGTLIVSDNPDPDKATIYLKIRLPVDMQDSTSRELNKLGVFLEALAQIQSLEASAMKTRRNLLHEIEDVQSANSPPRLGLEALRGRRETK